MRRLLAFVLLACLWVVAGAQIATGTGTILNDDAGGGSCAHAAFTPGGSDGQGGCFPDATTTGYSGSLTAFSGCTISSSGTYDHKQFNCEGDELVINANNVTITNSYVKGPIDHNGNGLTISDTEIDATPTPGTLITGYTFDGDDSNTNGSSTTTFTRVNIHGGRSNWYCPRNCTMQDSYTHGVEIPTTGPGSDAHMSAARQEQTTTYIHNTIACDWFPPTAADGGCSADATGYPDFAPIHHLTFNNNLFVANAGAAYCVYLGNTGGKPFSGDPLNATHVSVTNNIFQKGSSGHCADFGASTDYDDTEATNTWSGNKWDDGTTISPNQ